MRTLFLFSAVVISAGWVGLTSAVAASPGVLSFRPDVSTPVEKVGYWRRQYRRYGYPAPYAYYPPAYGYYPPPVVYAYPPNYGYQPPPPAYAHSPPPVNGYEAPPPAVDPSADENYPPADGDYPAAEGEYGEYPAGDGS